MKKTITMFVAFSFLVVILCNGLSLYSQSFQQKISSSKMKTKSLIKEANSLRREALELADLKKQLDIKRSTLKVKGEPLLKELGAIKASQVALNSAVDRYNSQSLRTKEERNLLLQRQAVINRQQTDLENRAAPVIRLEKEINQEEGIYRRRKASYERRKAVYVQMYKLHSNLLNDLARIERLSKTAARTSAGGDIKDLEEAHRLLQIAWDER